MTRARFVQRHIGRMVVCIAALGWLSALSTGCDPDQQPPAIWNANSRSLTLSCFAFFDGSMRFEAARAQLSAEQLALASNLRTIDAVPGCVQDVIECEVTVVRADGGTSTMDALGLDSACDQPRKVISFASLQPLLSTLDCRFAKNLTYDSAPAADPLAPDARCFNGVFTPYDGATIAVQLNVDDTTQPRHLELDDCDQPGRAGKLSFTLLDSDGTTPLGTSAPVADPGPNGACATLDQTFPHPGTFKLNIVAAPEILPAGDFFLRFY